jgi:hypothetical protein
VRRRVGSVFVSGSLEPDGAGRNGFTLTLNTARLIQWIFSLKSPPGRACQELSNDLFLTVNGQRKVNGQRGQRNIRLQNINASILKTKSLRVGLPAARGKPRGLLEAITSYVQRGCCNSASPSLPSIHATCRRSRSSYQAINQARWQASNLLLLSFHPCMPLQVENPRIDLCLFCVGPHRCGRARTHARARTHTCTHTHIRAHTHTVRAV